MHAAAGRNPGGENASVDVRPIVLGTVGGAQRKADICAPRMIVTDGAPGEGAGNGRTICCGGEDQPAEILPGQPVNHLLFVLIARIVQI